MGNQRDVRSALARAASATALCAALFVTATGCTSNGRSDPAGQPGRAGTSAAGQAAESVVDVWARVQATEYSGCNKQDCTDYLTYVAETVGDLGTAMEAAVGGQKRFAPAIELIASMNATIKSNGTDINHSKSTILSTLHALQQKVPAEI